jgi:sugar phosphate isomerase/epimerase
MQLGIISYAFHTMMAAGKIDLFGYLETCRYRYGLGVADIWNGMLLSTEADYIAKVRDGLDERELTLADLACDRCSIWEDDGAQREAQYQRALAHLRAGAALGARTVRIDAGSRAEAWTGEQFEHIVARYREYAAFAADHGFRVGPENHFGPEMDPEQLVALCRAVDSPAFGVLLHFGRWAGPLAGQGDAMIAPWTMHTHVNRTIMDDPEPPMRRLRDAGYRGCWSVEHVSDRYSELGAMLARVRDVLETWRLEA